MRIAVVGLGYVGLSNAVILAQHNEVVALDLDAARVESVNQRRSPIVDEELEDYLASKPLNLRATTDPSDAYEGASFVVIATPTDYDPRTNYFNTSSVESVIAGVSEHAARATIIVKSTVPVGFTTRMRDRYPNSKVIFSPEFLREGRALWDNLHPSRIIVGDTSAEAKQFADLLVEARVI